MTALDVISLQEAKDYLIVDFPDHDALITRLIQTSVALVEQHTQHRLYNRDVTKVIRCAYEIYDYPYTVVSLQDTALNSLAYEVTSLTLSDILKISYTTSSQSNYSLTLNVGYATKESIPAPLIDACYSLIAFRYENRDLNPDLNLNQFLSPVNSYRRYASI